MEGFLSKCLFETARGASNSTDVDALKFRLVQYDIFCDCKIQQDSSECLMVLIEFINEVSVPHCGFNYDNSTGFLYLKSYFHLFIVCDAFGLRSTSFESSSVLYIAPTYTSSMQDLIMQGMQQKLESPAFDVKRTWRNELARYLGLSFRGYPISAPSAVTRDIHRKARKYICVNYFNYLWNL